MTFHELIEDIEAERRARVLESARRVARRLVTHAPTCASITEDGVRVRVEGAQWEIQGRDGEVAHAVTPEMAIELAERALLAGRMP